VHLQLIMRTLKDVSSQLEAIQQSLEQLPISLTSVLQSLTNIPINITVPTDASADTFDFTGDSWWKLLLMSHMFPIVVKLRKSHYHRVWCRSSHITGHQSVHLWFAQRYVTVH
jgi:hypothetical protein